MRATHTPGPWTDDDPECDGFTGIFGADGDAVAYLVEPGAGRLTPLREGGEHVANGRLMAAAPDLLAACEDEGWPDLWYRLNAYASGKTQDQQTRVDPGSMLADVYQRLAVIDARRRAAIAKARGAS